MAHKDSSRGRSDAAGVGPYVRKGVRLARLSELAKYKVADGEPDIRGWEVRTISGRQLGEVAELLVDLEAGEVVMLDIDCKNGGRHSFAPVRAAMIDRASRVVRLDTGDLQDEELPSLAESGAGDEDARRFGERYERAYGERGWADDRDYVLPHGDDDVHFARRSARAAAEREAARRATEREVRIERRLGEVDEGGANQPRPGGGTVRYRERDAERPRSEG
ncbi:MAG: PRC-barrel domain-containing protein [Actinomycetota bacterium]|nr:PRC-barrel domain-containing protein [Actinomycetota bacterium]